jgi:catechol 2,3-dioxygenase-like lactoylglutathione lyase family enzyme
VPSTEGAATGPRLSAVKIPVADLQRASDFYVGELGLTAGVRYNEWEWELRVGPDDPTGIILCSDPEGELGEHHQMGPAMLVLRLADAVAAGERLRAYGIAQVSEPRRIESHGVVIVMAADPDGNGLELVSVS